MLRAYQKKTLYSGLQYRGLKKFGGFFVTAQNIA